LEASQSADIVVKASGVGVFDGLLEREVLARRAAHQTIIFWDVDAPATLERVREDSDDAFRPLIRRYDLILTYGGGPKVIDAYRALGAKDCIPIYNALDPTTHYPVSPDPAFQATLGFLGNRMPDRESRVDEFFFRVACMLPDHSLLLGGSGWGDKHPMPTNVRCVGHVYSRQHNSFNCSTCAVLNVNRDSMARFGYSPATRVFEAAGAGACLICDAWEGLDMFLEPDQEVLVARDGTDVAAHVQRLTPKLVSSIGQAARRRILSEHTYERRAEQLAKILGRRSTSRIATNRHQAYQT
jgi:spore maturation protein CgeB